MPNLSASIFVLWLALASSLPSVGRMHDLVLCFSSQGHVALESEHVNPDCAEVCGSSSVTEAIDSVHEESDSHHCFDLLLTRSDMRPNRTRIANGDWTPATIDFPASFAISYAIKESPPVARNSNEYIRSCVAQQNALRTVILRV